MRTLIVFNSVSLDGYFTDRDNRMDWAHNPVPDKEWDAFVEGNASGGGVLVFGRITYEMMASYWPTPAAARNDSGRRRADEPSLEGGFFTDAEGSRLGEHPACEGRLGGGDPRLKAGPGKDMAILGSGSIVAQLAREGLIDEYQVVVTPVVLGAGRTMFDGLPKPMPMKFVRSRVFANGNVLMCYVPAA